MPRGLNSASERNEKACKGERNAFASGVPWYVFQDDVLRI